MDVEKEVGSLWSALPSGSLVHRGSAPWFEYSDAEDARSDALNRVDALVHVQMNPSEERLDLYVTTWTRIGKTRGIFPILLHSTTVLTAGVALPIPSSTPSITALPYP